MRALVNRTFLQILSDDAWQEMMHVQQRSSSDGQAQRLEKLLLRGKRGEYYQQAQSEPSQCSSHH